MAGGSAYCAEHKAMPNIVLPPAPMAMLVRQATHQGLPAPTAGPTRHRRSAPVELSAALPHHRRTGAVSGLAVPAPKHRRTNAKVPLAPVQQAPKSEDERRFYANKLALGAAKATRQTTQEHMGKVRTAFDMIRSTAAFDACMDDEVGKWNRSALADKILRAMTPSMVKRPMLEDVLAAMKRLAESAAADDRIYAEGYFTDLATYCDAMIDKEDISFVFSQASLVLGPLLAPVMAAGAAGAAALALPVKAVSLAKSGVEFGIKKGVQAAMVDAPPAPGGAAPTVSKSLMPGKTSTDAVEPMRFTLAWMAMVTGGVTPDLAPAVKVIVDEFGGRKSVDSVYAWLKANNI
jgi:DNA-binding ferritin-like protein (Dps family)